MRVLLFALGAWVVLSIPLGVFVGHLLALSNTSEPTNGNPGGAAFEAVPLDPLHVHYQSPSLN